MNNLNEMIELSSSNTGIGVVVLRFVYEVLHE